MQYPEYDELATFIDRNPEYLRSWAEYSEFNHAAMEQVFQMLSDNVGGADIAGVNYDAIAPRIKDVGLGIHRRGGMDALRGCFYIFVAALRLRLQQRDRHDIDSLRVKVLDMRTALNYMWEGIGEWVP